MPLIIRKKASFTATPNPALVNQQVKFDGSASLEHIVKYEWDFGDGTTGVDKIIYHSFKAPATYSVKLTVTGDGGATSDVVNEIQINDVLLRGILLPW
jgi:PKD repeat protein